jgi:hypothetical protein
VENSTEKIKNKYTLVINQIKNIMKSQTYYYLAFRYINEFSFARSNIKRINIVGLTKYKYLLNYKKAVTFCNCEEPCCFRFQYKEEVKYICGCHEKKTFGIFESCYLNRDCVLSVRTEKTGFCVKIKYL